MPVEAVGGDGELGHGALVGDVDTVLRKTAAQQRAHHEAVGRDTGASEQGSDLVDFASVLRASVIATRRGLGSGTLQGGPGRGVAATLQIIASVTPASTRRLRTGQRCSVTSTTSANSSAEEPVATLASTSTV